MAGHSHWAGIKHKKGRADKLRSNLFSKLSREITVAAKLGDKDPGMNSRLRSAIQSAKSANMPKDNIQRAIDKSELNSEIDKMIENKESGMILLKLVEIIGEKELDELNSESLNFVIEIMNRTKLISLRNELLLEILPLKV